MGLSISSILTLLFARFNYAGKSTILYQLKLEKFVQTIPTFGFNLESVEYKNVCFNIFDLNAEDKIRAVCRRYFPDTQDELLLRDAPLLIFANKQDLPNAMSTYEFTEKLGLERIHDRQWYIQACSAKEGRGLYEGLHWLLE